MRPCSPGDGARRRRTARAQETAHKQGKLYGRSGPEALIRNLGMKMLGGERLRSRYDWIYTWRPPEETGSLA
jgi:salicylate hydroxylase